MNCLLCESPKTSAFAVKMNPACDYFHCVQCDLIFMDTNMRMLPEEEKIRYDLHQNQDSSGYRQFLQPLIHDIQNYSSKVSKPLSKLKILDYGCGPTAFLSKLLLEYSNDTINYDPFYFPDKHTLQATYDVITSTEVWEHFCNPRKEIARMAKLLKNFGLLAIMTASHPGVGPFHNWQYRRDMTHVVFFSEITMKWISDHFNFDLVKAQTPYWIFQKRA